MKCRLQMREKRLDSQFFLRIAISHVLRLLTSAGNENNFTFENKFVPALMLHPKATQHELQFLLNKELIMK